MPISIIIIPINLRRETLSSRKIIDPAVVSKNTMVAKIGYALDKSLKLKTRSQMINERP